MYDRRLRRPPPDCYHSDGRSGRARTSPTSGARRASSHSGRGAPPSRGGALQGSGRPWLVLLSAAGQPLLDLLQQPTVAVGIVERGIRGVRTAFGIWTRSAPIGACVKAAAETTAGIVEHLA
jgi:hypothetical protein